MKSGTSMVAALMRVGLSILSKLAPSAAARIATRIWFTPSLWSAPGNRVVPDGAESVSYEWGTTTIDGFSIGDGQRKALLVHGWAGSPRQYRRLATSLAASGFTVVAIDLPGHGRHAGTQTDLYEIADALNAVGRAVGPLDLVVAHSLGVAPTVMALQDSLKADTFVAIAPGVVPREAFETYVSMMGIDLRVASRVESGIDRRLGAGSLDRVAQETLTADVPIRTMIVQDTDDRVIKLEDARRLAASWGVPILITSGYGHNRVLAAPEVLDAIAQHVDSGAQNGGRVTASLGAPAGGSFDLPPLQPALTD